MGFLDKMKEKANEALETGTKVASSAVESGKSAVSTQQLKLQLKKLESDEQDALAGFGSAAYSLWSAGTLSMTSDLHAAAQQVADVRSAIEAKRAEIASSGDDGSEGNGAGDASEAAEAVTGEAAS
jgi:hypothetical protein